MKTDKKLVNVPHFLIILKKMAEGDKTISDLFRETKITLAHLYNTKKELMEVGWIYTEKSQTSKKNQIIKLTDKGKNVVKATNVILYEMGIRDNELEDYLLKSKRKESKDKDKLLSENDKEELDLLVDSDEVFN